MKKNELPIYTPPVIIYPHHAYPLSLVTTHPYFPSWFFSNYIQLVGFENPSSATNPLSFKNSNDIIDEHDISVDFFGPDYFFGVYDFNPLVDYQIIENGMFFKNKINIIDFVINCIDDEWYVFSHIDDFYIPDRSCYQKNRFIHDNFIYGYDSKAKIFNITGFNQEGIFTSTQMKFSQFEEAFYHSLDFRPFILMKPDRKAVYEFDIKCVAELLNDYLYALNTFEKIRMFQNPSQRLKKYTNRNSDILFGVKVYHFLIGYFELILEKGLIPDIKGLHLFWEHKKCMLSRIQYLFDQNYLNNLDIYQDYREIKNNSLLLRNLLLKWYMTKSERIIVKIIAGLKELNQQEVPILETLLNKISM